LFKGKKIRKIILKKDKKLVCRHDYKNAIKIGNIDYQCQMCGRLLDPLEWFLMNNFEFVDVITENKIPAKKGGQVAKNARLELKQKTGKKVVSGRNFKQLPEQKKLRGK